MSSLKTAIATPIYLSLFKNQKKKKKKQIDLSFSQQKVSTHKRKKKHKVDFNKLFVIHHTGDDCEFLVWIYLVFQDEFGKMTILSKINENTRVKEASIIN